MKEPLPASATLQSLERAIASGRLPDDAVKTGNRMLERLRAPVRVVLLGLPGAGKSKIFNLLAGQDLIPENARIPTIELKKGAEPKTICTLTDGSTREFPGSALQEADAIAPIFVQIEAALPALEKISLLEVVAAANDTEQRRALAWAARRADIGLWCSPEFTEQEQALWERMPDALKDHSFLVLTKADVLAEKGVLQQRIAQLQGVVAEDFHSLIPIATLQATAARGADGTLDPQLFASSGGKALITAVLRQVQVGRRADLDNVDVFLARYSEYLENKGEDNTTAVSPPQVETPARAAAAPAPSNITEIRPAPVSDPEVEREPVIPQPLEQADRDVTALCARAVDHMIERARSLSEELPDLGPGASAQVLEHCIDTLEHLDELVSSGGSKHTILNAIRDQCLDVSDTLMLMQLENTDTVAADAITMLLQLKREFEAKMYPDQGGIAQNQHLSATIAP